MRSVQDGVRTFTPAPGLHNGWMGSRAAAMSLTLGGVLVFGCGDDETSSGGDGISPKQKQSNCESQCARWEECLDDFDEGDCIDDCIEAKAYSAEAYAANSSCLEAASCGEIRSEGIDDCVEDELRGLPLSNGQTAFCAKYADKWADCDTAVDQDDAVRECEKGVRLVSPEYVDALDECLSLSCQRVDDCLADQADSFDSELTPNFTTSDTGGNSGGENSGNGSGGENSGNGNGGGGGGGGGGDSCEYAFDGECDEPDLCDSGADTTDCSEASL